MSDPWAAKYGKYGGAGGISKPAVVARPATVKAGSSATLVEKPKEHAPAAKVPPPAVPNLSVPDEGQPSGEKITSAKARTATCPKVTLT